MRTMYDSVTAGDIPNGAHMVAGYVDGHYKNVDALYKRFPHAVVVGIAVNSHTNDGHVLDVESGDATPTEAVQWVIMRRHAGKDPTVYTNSSEWPLVKEAFRAAGVTGPHYWIAQWDGDTTIPGGAVAKQYKTGTRDNHYDTSSVHDYWPGVDPVSISQGYYIVKSGDTMTGIAASHHMSLKALEDKNPQIHNYNLIYPGQHINV